MSVASPSAFVRPIRWGIVGAGAIAVRFARDLAHCPGALVTAVFARRQEQAQQLVGSVACAHGALATDDLARFLAAPIDAVYVATLPDTHHHFSRAALLAGHAVLCEKPVTRSLSELDDLLDLARSRGLLFMEAMKTPFLPVYRELRQLLETGTVIRGGEAVHVAGSFGPIALVQAGNAAAGTPSGHPSWSVALAGGALMSIGVYQAFLAVDHLGPALEVQALSNPAAPDSGAPPSASPPAETVVVPQSQDPVERASPGTPAPASQSPVAASAAVPDPSIPPTAVEHHLDPHNPQQTVPLSSPQPSSSVDLLTLVQCRHPHGLSQLYAGLQLVSPGTAVLSATGGVAIIHKPWWNPSRITLTSTAGDSFDLHSPVVGDGLHYEAAHFADLLHAGPPRDSAPWQSPVMTHAHSRAVMHLLDRARAAIGLRFGEVAPPRPA